ncbi:hypothetical protein BpHYR1_001378 [Brachionus plicatilis]|uniref:Uncharacterized protein n=1 Tax=Brachionus plicatilis TaxID=10195 RepID=A0A3M7PDW2_BRAPC|nr:hypothetical protein BpHYR1_001378 [Brachionus plicatilis]
MEQNGSILFLLSKTELFKVLNLSWNSNFGDLKYPINALNCLKFQNSFIFKNRKRKGRFYKEIALVPVESSDAAILAAKKALSKQSNPRLFLSRNM